MAAFFPKKHKKTLISMIDCILSFSVAKKKDNGEDWEAHALNTEAAFFGVFDGCGGSGAQTCPRFHGKTEAYIASRVTAEAFQEWFELGCEDGEWSAEAVKDRTVQYLTEANESVGEASVLMGGIKKKFPTTAAVGICYLQDGKPVLDYYWAGDSRVYLLNADGLAQLTEDDLGDIDAMENLRADGILTNVCSLSKDFEIHTGRVSLDKPAIVFAATDGCFGYLSTPMEFEFMLLRTLMNSDCVSADHAGVSSSYLEDQATEPRTGWMECLREQIEEVAGDDYSISGYAINFGGWQDMRKTLIPRANEMFNHYIEGLDKKSYEEKLALWEEYKGSYYRMVSRP